MTYLAPGMTFYSFHCTLHTARQTENTVDEPFGQAVVTLYTTIYHFTVLHFPAVLNTLYYTVLYTTQLLWKTLQYCRVAAHHTLPAIPAVLNSTENWTLQKR